MFFGDSITAGVGASNNANRWSSRLAASAGLSELNSGVAGTVLQNSTPKLANNLRDRFFTAMQQFGYGEKVYILSGLNDVRYNGAAFSASAYQTQLGELVDQLIKIYGHKPTDITVGSPPYCNPAFYTSSDYTPFNAGSTAKHQEYVAAARAVAVQYKTKYADVYQAMLTGGGNSLVSSDGIHPNDSGHQVIANAMVAASVPS